MADTPLAVVLQVVTYRGCEATICPEKPSGRTRRVGPVPENLCGVRIRRCLYRRPQLASSQIP
jgi:hypothetical protein